MSQNHKIVVICGPTATGKTALAVKLAKEFGGEIVSADSRQIYQELDIGSGRGKPPESQRGSHNLWVEEGIPIHLYNILKPTEQITVIKFRDLALDKIDEIRRRKKIPFLVGGTGFYISAVLGDTAIEAIPPNPRLREAMELLSLAKLNEILANLDSKLQKEIDQKNKRRLIRAIERCEYEKNSAKGHPHATAPTLAANPLLIGLTAPKDYLDDRIDARTERMLEEGLIDEVKLILMKHGSGCPALDAIGYRQFIPYILGETDLDTAVIEKNTAEHQYAKRQMTWFKRDTRIKWFDITQPFDQEIQRLVRSYLKDTAHG